MINFDYQRTSTAKAAVDAKAKSASSQFIAGGTNLVDLMKKGVTSPDKLIDINGLPLKQITADAKGITIGALALNSDVAENAIIKTKYPFEHQPSKCVKVCSLLIPGHCLAFLGLSQIGW